MPTFTPQFSQQFAGAPVVTTWGDICKEALAEAGAIGIGMIPLSEDLLYASSKGQDLLQQWERKRWMVYHLLTYTVLSTGQGWDGTQLNPYTVGPTLAGTLTPQISVGAYGFVSRPNRIESAFFRQLITAPNGPVDYPLKMLPSLEDYNQIRLKGLTNFARVCYYDPAWPLGNLYVYPWPQANIYEVGITVREQLMANFAASLSTAMNLPFEYHRALKKNIAVEVCPRYGITLPPGSLLLAQAKDSRDCLVAGNTAIPLLNVPSELGRGGMYNIYTDSDSIN